MNMDEAKGHVASNLKTVPGAVSVSGPLYLGRVKTLLEVLGVIDSDAALRTLLDATDADWVEFIALVREKVSAASEPETVPEPTDEPEVEDELADSEKDEE